MIKQTLDAVFENGVFRPLTQKDISISEGQQVRLVIETADSQEDILDLAAKVYNGLSEQQINEIEQIATDRRNFFTSEKPL